MAIVVPNFARTTLRAPITPSSTVLQLAAGGGAYFAIGTGNYVYLTVEDGNSVEIMIFTNTGVIVNDEITVTRGQDGTTPKSFPAGACVKVAWNVGQLQALVNQTFYTLFNTDALPPNTIQVVAVPVAPPPNNVIYAVFIAEQRFWYWSGSAWVELGNAGACVLAGTTDPSGSPGNVAKFYVNTTTGELFYWTGSAWLSIAGAAGSTEEYWVRGANGGTLYTLNANQQVELGVIATTDRYRTYPGGVPANTILAVQDQGGSPRTTLLDDAAMDVWVTIRGTFAPNAAPEAVMNMVISNSYSSELFGNQANVDTGYLPDITLSASTGVLTWPAGTYFDGNLVYTLLGGGPSPDFIINQVNIGFHVVEAGVGP